MTTLPRNQVLIGDACEQLAMLPDRCVNMVLTSPPYFRLRNYQVPGQLGLEEHVDEWVDSLRAVCQQIARVLVPTGTLWLNLGDSFSVHIAQGAHKKSLFMAPERLAFALLTDGWIIRNKIVWAKTNPMPTSVQDRLGTTYEIVYVLARSRSYFFDLDAIREPHRGQVRPVKKRPNDVLPEAWRGPNADRADGLATLKLEGRSGHPLGKNPGDVWQLATANYRGAHFATFPKRLAERAIRAGCPEARCRSCQLPWQRARVRHLGSTAVRANLQPECDCKTRAEPGLVLDPFLGAGTTAVVAEELHRDWLGVELNSDFAAMCLRRLAQARALRMRPKAHKGAAPAEGSRREVVGSEE